MILFTGMTGTSGSSFVDVLVSHNFKEPFRVLVRENSNTKQIKTSGLNYEFAYGSLTDQESLVKAMTGCDCIFHIAAKGMLKQVCNAAVKAKTIRQCILVSSTSIFSSYRKTEYLKRDEDEIKQQLEEHNIIWTIIRPTMIFGTLNDRNISTFMKWLDKYPVFPIVKKGSALVQPVFRYDLAEAYFLIMINRNQCKYEEFVVSGKEPITLKEALVTISRSIGKKTFFINVPFLVARGGVSVVFRLTNGKIDYREKLYRLTENRAFDHSKISERFGYDPRSFEEGVFYLSGLYKSEKGLTN